MTPIEQYAQLQALLNGLIPTFRFSADINLRLERIARLMALLGNPERQFAVIHVGGTSGKGSTASMIAAILTEAGYKTGLHTSPNLQIFNERHQIDGVVAPTSHLLALLEEMQPTIAQIATEMPEYGNPSYFEVQFALSCLYFARHAVDVAVIEVGLGGTRDATNVVQSQVAVLTSVGLDHTSLLGDTIEEIMGDKVGIVKPNQTVITGVTQPSAQAIIAERCEQLGNQLWSLGEQFEVDSAEPNTLSLTINNRHFPDIELGLIGNFQHANAACALSAALAFAPDLPERAIYAGLQKVRFAGRMEVMQTHPLVILDGAHNPDKMQSAAASVENQQGKIVLLLGMKLGKEVDDVLLHALPLVDQVIATEFRMKGLWKPVPAQAIVTAVERIAPKLPVSAEPDPLLAIKQALAAADPHDLIWVTGSLYLVGDVREFWYTSEELIISAETDLTSTLIP